MQQKSKENYVYTVETSCQGCNKCIFKCPTNANRAYWENSKNIVGIKNGYCISCGECISICDHGARDFVDDISAFIEDLEKGDNISLVIAPSAHVNFDKLGKLIGFLKSKGVKKIYDVSFGADITTWGYLKFIKDHNPKTVIAQPCPVVVSYIEKFHSDLIKYLAPVQSPVVCLGIYLKKYENEMGKLAFLSPCIGKKRECKNEHTYNILSYNITFLRLSEYIEKNNINLDDYPDLPFDNVEKSLGFAFPRPGGLSENVKYHLGDVWTKQIEGIYNIEHYFEQLLEDLDENLPVPLIIDALNCEKGCNVGTASSKNIRDNFIDNNINSRKKVIQKNDTEALTKFFNETLDYNDFVRKYSDKSDDYISLEDIDVEPIFRKLGKFTKEDKITNCFSCGYGTCYEFAKAVANGDNHINNCHHFLLEKFVSLSTRDSLTGAFNRYSYIERMTEAEESHSGLIGILFVDINKLKETNDLYGHEAGDALIISACSVLQKFFENDIYRIGGDEFVVVQRSYSKSDFENKVSKLREYLEVNTSVLMSVGYEFSYNADDLSEAVNTAEKNMYAAKALFYKKNARYDRRK